MSLGPDEALPAARLFIEARFSLDGGRITIVGGSLSEIAASSLPFLELLIESVRGFAAASVF